LKRQECNGLKHKCTMLCAHCESPNVTISATNDNGVHFFCCVECKNYYEKLKINEALDEDIATTKQQLQQFEQHKHKSEPELYVLLKRVVLLRMMMLKQLKTRDKVLIQTMRGKCLESIGAVLELYNQYVQSGKLTEAYYIDQCNSQKQDMADLETMIESI
jgi:hypothetical protein